MRSTTKIIRTISLIGACALAVTVARAVAPPPDGGYPNENTAEGEDALFSLTTGEANTATGFQALFSNTDGLFNTAIGNVALYSNTTGVRNTATGDVALASNTTGFYNTATGDSALAFNTTGSFNTATGAFALYLNATGIDNTAIGENALIYNTTGGNNTASGSGALSHNTTGNNNIALGESAGTKLTTGNNNIDIGNKGVAGESNTIRIGRKGTQTTTRIAGISGTAVAGGVGVIIDTNGQLGTVVSSGRFKDGIKPMAKSSEAILSLKPVTFRYKKDLDPQAIPQFGLVAEEVAKVDPDLVAKDEHGKPYTVRYEAVNAMLLNEFLKAHKKVETQQDQINALTSELQAMHQEIEEMKSQEKRH